MSSETPTKAESRAQHQLNLYDKVLAAEVVEWAKRESEARGVELPKNTLAREVFAWAWPIYKAAGSLAKLKKLALSVNPLELKYHSGTEGRSSTIEAAETLELLERGARANVTTRSSKKAARGRKRDRTG